MKKFLIVTLVMLFGMGMMGGSALGDSYDPTYNPAAVTPAYPYGVPPIQQIGGMLWNHGNIGDALSGPMYRAVVDQDPDPFNFVSFVSIENVSNNFVAAHVRLRSGRYSIEVRDFPILLSPRDVFWFQFEVEADIDGNLTAVKIVSQDTNTLTLSGLPSPWEVNLDPELLNQFELLYPDGAPLEEMTQGYIEVFGLFELPTILGFPNFDAVMDMLWTRNDNTAAAAGAGYASITNGFVNTRPQDVGKSLAGHVFLGDFTNGLYFGYPMNAIKDFRTNCTDISGPLVVPAIPLRIEPSHRDIDAFMVSSANVIVNLRLGGLAEPAPAVGDWGGQNAAGGWYPAGCILYNPTGSDAAYSDPDWATSFGPTWNDGDDLTGLRNGVPQFPIAAVDAVPAALYAVWPFDSWSLDEVDDAMVKQRVQNTYFNGGFSYIPADPLNSGTFTLLSVSFITKYLHYFYDWGSGLMNPDTAGPIGDAADGAPAGLGSRRYGWPVGFQTGQAPTIRAQMDVEGYTGVVSVRTSAWDFEENRPDDFSPYTRVNFPWEVNFLPIGDLSIDRLDDFCFLIVPQPDSPFDLVEYDEGYFGGQMFLEGFNLTGGVVAGDPRTIQYNTPSIPPVVPFNAGGYGRAVLPLLGLLQAAPYNDAYIMPASVVVMDWEFTNFSHARSFFANWDNQVLPAGDYPVP